MRCSNLAAVSVFASRHLLAVASDRARASRSRRQGAELAASSRGGGEGSLLGSLPTLPSASAPSVVAHQRIDDQQLVCLARDLGLRCSALARSGELRAPKRPRPSEAAEDAGIVSDDENCSSGGDTVDKDTFDGAGASCGPAADSEATTSNSRSKRACAAAAAPVAPVRLPSSQEAETTWDSAIGVAAEGCMGPPSSSQPAADPSSSAAKAAARRMVGEALPGAVVRSVRAVEGVERAGGRSPLEAWRRDAHQSSKAGGAADSVDTSVSFLWLLQDGIPANRIGAAVTSLHRRAMDLVARGRIPHHASVPTKVQPRVRLNVTKSALLAVADAATGRFGPQATSLRAALDAAASAPRHRRPGVFVRFEIVLVAACLGKVSTCASPGAATTALDASCLAVAASVPSGSHSLEVVPPDLPSGAGAPILTVASPCQVSPALIVAVDLPVPARALAHLVWRVSGLDAAPPGS